MSGINKICASVTAGLLMIACQTLNAPRQYLIPLVEIKTNTYGSWMNLTTKAETFKSDTLQTESFPISGELICIEADTIFILVRDSHIRPIYFRSVLHAELITHSNQAAKYGLIAFIGIIPSLIGAIGNAEFAGGFLLLAVPAANVGLFHLILESSAHKNILKYPERNSLDDLSLFARFPAGKPVNVNFHQLTLKKPNEKWQVQK